MDEREKRFALFFESEQRHKSTGKVSIHRVDNYEKNGKFVDKRNWTTTTLTSFQHVQPVNLCERSFRKHFLPLVFFFWWFEGKSLNWKWLLVMDVKNQITMYYLWHEIRKPRRRPFGQFCLLRKPNIGSTFRERLHGCCCCCCWCCVVSEKAGIISIRYFNIFFHFHCLRLYWVQVINVTGDGDMRERESARRDGVWVKTESNLSENMKHFTDLCDYVKQ